MSILIDNFSIDVGKWVELEDTTTYSVDVLDLNYTISTSGTYFLIDDVYVPTNFSSISNGYKAECSFPTISGSYTVTIHAENSASQVLELDFNLLFGYHVEFSKYTDWGPNNEITIFAKAKNLVTCSNEEAYSTYFRTGDLYSSNLSASIFPVVSPSIDLSASIFPQSKHFKYGKTYNIKVSGIKDFAGNKLPEFNFSFKIEDN